MSTDKSASIRCALCEARARATKRSDARSRVGPQEENQLDRNVPLLAGVLGLLLFVTIWLAVSLVLSFVGGWRVLAREYRAPHAVPETGWIERRVLFSGQARYRNVLRLTADKSGVYLAVAFPFRIGHPPLFIPWEDLFAMPAGAAPVGSTELRFRKVVSPRMLVSDETLRRLDESAPRPWRAV